MMNADQGPLEEDILVGDDLMTGLPSPIIPSDIASHVMEGVEKCDGILKNLFLCLQINDVEPFCQDDIFAYRRCAQNRDKQLRRRIEESERRLGQLMPVKEAQDRAAELQSQATLLKRRLILASGIEGIQGFRQRWSLNGRLLDTKMRLDALNKGLQNRKASEKAAAVSDQKKRWLFW